MQDVVDGVSCYLKGVIGWCAATPDGSAQGRAAKTSHSRGGGPAMARPVTLFTGQFADIPIAELAPLAKAWGYDGLELACWGDHFEVPKAVGDPLYAYGRRTLLEEHGLGCWAVGAHLVGQAVADHIIDER